MLTKLLRVLVPRAAGEPPPRTSPCPDGDLPCEKIAARAYEIWCERGKPAGTDLENWAQAERELKATYGRNGTP